MIESAKKLRELSPLLVEGRASRPFKPSNARPAFSTLPNPVLLSGAGSSAKRMIQRSRRTPTLFGGCPWLLISPARQAPGVPIDKREGSVKGKLVLGSAEAPLFRQRG